MSAPQRRGLTIDDPVGGRQACHVAQTPAPNVTESRLREIPVQDIRPNPDQPRKHFDEDALRALAGSIRERGVLQPIIVKPISPDEFELVAGERRWRAAKLAGRGSIPALINPSQDDSGSLELALIENVVRENLTPIEEARTIALLIDDLNITAADLAKRLGRSRTDLAHTVRLLHLPDNALELINAGQLSKGHGKALLTEPDHHRQRVLASRAVRDGWSVRALEAEIARGQNSRPKRQLPHPDQEAAAARLQDVLSKTTGADARVRPHRLGYQVILDPTASERLIESLRDETSA